MSGSQSQRRFALVAARLLFSAALLASVSTAWAENITYNIVDYPVNQSDQVTSTIDTISGTIITNGALGLLTSADIIGGSITWTNSVYGSYTPPDLSTGLTSVIIMKNVQATPTALLLPFGAALDILSHQGGPYTEQVLWSNGYNFGVGAALQYKGSVQSNVFPGPNLFAWSAAPPSASPGSIAASSTWIIATAVPEPGALTLLGSALLGLAGAAYLRRRRAMRSPAKSPVRQYPF